MRPTSDLRTTANGVSGDAPSAHDLDQLLTVDEVAAMLKVSKSWVYEHTRTRGVPRGERFPHVKLGKYVRFEARHIRAFIARRTHTA